MEHKEHFSHQDNSNDSGGKLKLATSATVHCLLGCGIGEVVDPGYRNCTGAIKCSYDNSRSLVGFCVWFWVGVDTAIEGQIYFKGCDSPGPDC